MHLDVRTKEVTSSNGLSPRAISNNTKPTLHTSLDFAYGFPRNRSGDMYRVVPTTVLFIIVPPSPFIPSSPCCLLLLRYNTKVSQLHPPLQIYQHIHRLDITMQHPLKMKIAQSPYYLVGNGSNGIRYQCCRLIPGGTFVIVHECSLKFYFYQAITME